MWGERFRRVLVSLSLLSSPAVMPSVAWGAPPLDAAALDAEWERLGAGAPRDGTDNQRLARLVLDGARIGWDTDKMIRATRLVESQRETRAAARNPGNMRWYWNDPAVVDSNGVEFINRLLVLAPLVAGERMPPALSDALRPVLLGDLAGIRAHKVAVAYTNIHLMKTWNLVALGRVLNDPSATREGASMLDAWLEAVRASGAREYLSPTYTAVDLENLGLLVRWSGDPAIAAKARAGMNYLWATTRLFWFAPAGRLGGAHSRDYDRLTGHGPLDGWSRRVDDPTASPDSTLMELAWVPPDAGVVPSPPSAGSTAVLRWDGSAFATWRRGRAFGIGTATDTYWDMDKSPLVIDLAEDPKTPVINLWLDGRRDYHGVSKILEGSGHMKSLHLKPFVAAAQRGARALVLVAGTSEGTPRLDATISLPAGARYYVNGEETRPFNAASAWTLQPAPETGRTDVRVEDHALVVEDRSPDKGVGVARDLPIAPGARTRATLWGSGGDFAMYHNYFDRDGRRIGAENIKSIRDRAGDGPFVLETVAPPGAERLRVWLYSSVAGTGTFRVRDVRVEDVGDPARPKFLAGFDWRPFEPFDREIPTGATLIVRMPHASAALRALLVRGADGTPATFHLNNDGLALGAFRLTAALSETRTDRRGVVVMWAEAADTPDDAAFARFMKRATTSATRIAVEGSTIVAEASDGPLRLRVDPDQKTREVEPTPAPGPVGTLWLDGREIGAAMLGR